MKFSRKEKGIAGLNVLMSVVSMLFMIGIIVMVFIVAGDKLTTEIGDRSSGSVSNETIALLNLTAVSTTVAVLDCGEFTDSTILVTNETTGELVESANYTESGGYFTSTTSNTDYISPTNVNVSGSYTYCGEGTAALSIYKTTQAIDDTTDWFSTFIVLAALVVMVLLVVIIINSIKGSNLGGDNTA